MLQTGVNRGLHVQNMEQQEIGVTVRVENGVKNCVKLDGVKNCMKCRVAGLMSSERESGALAVKVTIVDVTQSRSHTPRDLRG